MTTRTAEIDGYLDGVRAALADLLPSTRDELLEDLPEHLADVAAENEGSLWSRLGPPVAYAAELRAAAGIPGSGPTSATAPVGVRVEDVLRRANSTVGHLLGYPKLTDLLVDLRPGWWVARGAAVGLLVTLYLHLYHNPVPSGVDWLAPVAGVVGSLHLGRVSARTPLSARMVITVCNALIALAVLTVLVRWRELV